MEKWRRVHHARECMDGQQAFCVFSKAENRDIVHDAREKVQPWRNRGRHPGKGKIDHEEKSILAGVYDEEAAKDTKILMQQ